MIKIIRASILLWSVLLSGCGSSSHEPASSGDYIGFELQFNEQVRSIVLSGVFEAPDNLVFHLATPVFSDAEVDAGSAYSVGLSSSDQRWPVTLSKSSKGTTHFEVTIPVDKTIFEVLELYHGNSQVTRVTNTRALSPDWLDEVQLELNAEELCLTWPEEQFSQASILQIEEGRLRVVAQSSASLLCTSFPGKDATAVAQDLRFNLRSRFFAVQLKAVPYSSNL